MNDSSFDSNSRIEYIDVLRIIATVAVIGIHVSTLHMDELPIKTQEWQAHNLYDSICRWSVPIFIMISGALFLSKEKIDIQRLYKKNISRIISALVFWSIIYAFFQYYTIDKYHSFSSLIGLFITGHYHLWFLYMILGIYICLPVLKAISRHENIMYYYLIASFVFTFVVPLIIEFVNLALPSQVWATLRLHPYFLWVLQHNYESFFPHTVIGYSFYSILGYYLHIKTITPQRIRFTIIIGLCGILITIIATSLLSTNEKFYSVFYDYLNICPLFAATGVFLIHKHCSCFCINPKLIHLLSKTSFGTYLVHPLIIEVFSLFGYDLILSNPFITIPCYIIIIFIVSTFVSYILNGMPIIKKFCV